MMDFKAKMMKRCIHRIVIVILIILFVSSSFAENLGTFGQVHGIAEEDFLSFIQKRLLVMQANGEWKKIEDQFKENVKRHADRPTPVSNITTAIEYKTWDYDPSITVPYDLRDSEGHIIAKAGTTVNPLSYINLHHALLFIDGDDSKQIQVAKGIDNVLKGRIKLVLVRGSVTENEKRFNKPIYFDQGGSLVSKFNIQHVPALVWQNGLVLKVQEIKP